MSNATLIAHRGAVTMSRQEIAHLPFPVTMGPYHKPIPHIELLDTLDMVLKEGGWEISTEQFAVGKAGIFGVISLDGEINEDMGPAIGFRAGNICNIALQFVAGSRVFVCDNMALSGSFKVLKKRHTTNLNLADELRFGFQQLALEFRNIGDFADKMKERSIRDEEAKAFLYDAAVTGRYPYKLLEKTHAEYFEPRHEVFRPRNMWGLHNAVTETVKTLPSMNARLEVLEDMSRREQEFMSCGI